MLLSPMNPVQFDHVHSATLSLQPGVFSPGSLSMPPTKRPKLSLQTSLPSSYGSSASATGKRIDNLSAVTPTTLNTFNNTFELTLRPSPNSATTSPAPHLFRKAAASPLRRHHPYSLNLPLGVRPILKNSRLQSEYGSLTASASPRTGRRVFFPPTKKVTFNSIDEEIVTHTYTARYIDLSPSEDEDWTSGSDKDESNQEQDCATPTQSMNALKGFATEEGRSRSPQLESRGRRRRERSTSGHRNKKKRRRWEWTLENEENGDQVEQVDQASPAAQCVDGPARSGAISLSEESSKHEHSTDQDTTPTQSKHDTIEELDISSGASSREDDRSNIESGNEIGKPTGVGPEDVPLPPSPTQDSSSHVMAMVKCFEEIDRGRSWRAC